MWAPGIGAIVAVKASGKSLGTLNLKRLGPKRFYLWAWLLFPILSLLTGVVTVLFGVAEFDSNFTLISESLTGMPDTGSLNPAMIVGLQILAAFTLAPLFNTIFALGEEIGWRGFLLPKLLPLGEWKAIIISNVIWGFWHAPAIILGNNYPGYPIVGVFMMIVFTILLGIIFSWLYLKTKSPWAPALAHGSVNAVAGLSVLFLMPWFDLAIGGTLASVMGWIPLGLFALWLVATRRVPVGGDDEIIGEVL
jgi:membrane protease YdiL (CAAX protease family)